MDAKKVARNKIIDAINNHQNLSESELESIWNEMMMFMATLPENERGDFYWTSGLETLYMLAPVSQRSEPND